MQVNGNFRFSVVQPLLLALECYLLKRKMDISVLIQATWLISSFQLFQNEKKQTKQAQKFLNNFQSQILTTLFAQ